MDDFIPHLMSSSRSIDTYDGESPGRKVTFAAHATTIQLHEIEYDDMDLTSVLWYCKSDYERFRLDQSEEAEAYATAMKRMRYLQTGMWKGPVIAVSGEDMKNMKVHPPRILNGHKRTKVPKSKKFSLFVIKSIKYRSQAKKYGSTTFSS